MSLMKKLGAFSAALALVSVALSAQDRLKSMPGYERVQQMARESQTAVRGGTLAVAWADDGESFEYTKDGKRYRFDLLTRQPLEIGAPTVAGPSTGAGRGGRGQAPGVAQPERGRQFDSTASPDGALKAYYKERNVWLSAMDGSNALAVTTDGSVASRVKYGTATWVYGEELSQRTAMWWSPDGTKLAYYRFDESQIPDFYLALDQTRTQTTLDAEAYPKAGVPNPIVDLFVYDVATKRSQRVDVRDGKPFDNTAVGHYVYHVEWSRDGRELLFFRTNRRQNIMEVAAANPDVLIPFASIDPELPAVRAHDGAAEGGDGCVGTSPIRQTTEWIAAVVRVDQFGEQWWRTSCGDEGIVIVLRPAPEGAVVRGKATIDSLNSDRASPPGDGNICNLVDLKSGREVYWLSRLYSAITTTPATTTSAGTPGVSASIGRRIRESLTGRRRRRHLAVPVEMDDAISATRVRRI